MPRVVTQQLPQKSPQQLAEELAELWADTLAAATWPDRLQLLGDIHDQIRSDIGDLDVYCAVSPIFVAGLLERMEGGGITCVEQAHIYSNSADKRHRDAAGKWLKTYHKPSDGG